MGDVVANRIRVTKPGSRNQILRTLLADDMQDVNSDVKRVQLTLHQILYKAGQPLEWIYFPEDAVISFFGDTRDGSRIELWSVGDDGVAGPCGTLEGTSAYDTVVQVAGTARVADVAIFRKSLQSRSAFRDAIAAYYQRLVVHVAQIGLCNSAHEVQQRLSRWLLMMEDRARVRTFPYTQDFIAAVLGTRRATISVAAAALRDAGAIHYGPGSLTIASRRVLLAATCTCYHRLRQFSRTT
jgi:CRP-like cAMP-binding protein